MKADFWIKCWKEGRIDFHLKEYHEKLLKYFPQLNVKAGERVLVPLCGKTRDMEWLSAQGLEVHGVEFYEEAVKAYFIENKIELPEPKEKDGFKEYESQNIRIYCGDFFKFKNDGEYDYIYDKGGLVALPLEMRERYVEKIKSHLKKGGRYFLIGFEYDEGELVGPPFSVSEGEIKQFFGEGYKIQVLDIEDYGDEDKRNQEKNKRMQKEDDGGGGKDNTDVFELESLVQRVYLISSV